jgi:hypothetical protein
MQQVFERLRDRSKVIEGCARNLLEHVADAVEPSLPIDQPPNNFTQHYSPSLEHSHQKPAISH